MSSTSEVFLVIVAFIFEWYQLTYLDFLLPFVYPTYIRTIIYYSFRLRAAQFRRRLQRHANGMIPILNNPLKNPNHLSHKLEFLLHFKFLRTIQEETRVVNMFKINIRLGKAVVYKKADYNN